MNTTFDLLNASQIIPAVQNFYDWTSLYDRSTFFALMNNLGMVDIQGIPTGGKGKGNYKIEFNKLTGMTTKYTTGANLTAASGNLNLKTINTTSVVDFISSALTLVNITPREGLAFRIIGNATIGGSPVACNVLFRVNSVAASPNYTVELLDTNLASTSGADTATNIVSGATLYVTDVAEFGGEAPIADDMDTTQDFNYIQMYDLAYGKNIVAKAQNVKFDNSMVPLQNAVQSRMFRSINSDLMFGETGSAPASGKDYGTMKGLWGMLKLRNTAADTDLSKVVAKVDSGTTVDFKLLEKAVSSRDFGSGQLIAFTTKDFSSELAHAARMANETVRTEVIDFPRFSVIKRTMTVGDTIFNVISDNTLMSHPTFSDGSLVAGQGKLMICLDPSRAKLVYHQNDRYGVMIPKIEDVNNDRKKRVEEYHMLACLSLAVWDKAAHFAYGITGTGS